LVFANPFYLLWELLNFCIELCLTHITIVFTLSTHELKAILGNRAFALKIFATVIQVVVIFQEHEMTYSNPLLEEWHDMTTLLLHHIYGFHLEVDGGIP